MNIDTQQNNKLTLQQILDGGSAYFIGIGGIGMSALARFFRSKGVKVSGYDKTETPLTRQLVSEGMEVNYKDAEQLAPANVSIVVYTPAVPRNHPQLLFYRKEGYPVLKRSDVLQMISESSFNICIGGTHGKTTITSMVAHLLRHSGYGCNAFLGGISTNYQTNFWSSDNNVAVIEADEYDRSFLKLSPDVAVITSMDADHLDIYGDEKTMQDAFVEFGNKVKEGGLLLHKFGLSRLKDVKAERWQYSLQNDAADVHASNITIQNGGYRFDAVVAGTLISGFELKIGGMHNVENAVAAIAIAARLEIEEQKIKEALSAFEGVKRRFEYVIPPQQQVDGGFKMPILIDDYAHHPAELNALLKSVKTLFPQYLVTVVFQPHLFTRTRDLAEGFASALSVADRVLLLPIYPAREEPIEGVSSEMILNSVEREEKQLVSKEELLNWMKGHTAKVNKEFGEVVVMAGAGDIDALVQPVKEIIEKNW